MTIDNIENPREPRRLPMPITWVVVAICVLPTLLAMLPVGKFLMPQLEALRADPIKFHFIHNILEGASFFTAFFTVTLAIAHYWIRKDIVTPVLGISLFASGLVDILHLLASNRMFLPVGDVGDFEPFTWTVSRFSMSMICLVSIGILMHMKPKKSDYALVRSILIVGGVIGTITIVTTLIAASQPLPKAIYRDSLIVRPWDLIPLFAFGFSAIVFINFNKQFPSMFSHALLVSSIPNFVGEFHMAVGAENVFDYHAITAHTLKIVAYLVPFSGLVLDYIHTYLRYERVVWQLHEESEAKSRFVANVSHELRTPMNAIIGTVELLSEKLTSREDRRKLAVISSAGDTLTALVNDLLDLSKAQSGKLLIENRPVNLNKAIEDSVALFAVRAAQKRIALSSQFIPDEATWVLTDEVRLKQIVYNLTNNAVKFTETGFVKIEINTQSPGEVMITVTDSGIGIAVDKQKTIFEQFVQADNSITRKYGGTGLGLSITKNLIELMNGKITLHSTVGKGSTFVVTLPLETCAPVSEEPMAANGEILDFKGSLPILVVDDVDINRDIVSEFLQEVHCDVVEAESAERAIELIKSQKFSMVLMDLQMPGMDGLTATRFIREWEAQTKSPRLPIVAFTAHASFEEAQKALSFGCDSHLAKPVRRANLLEVVNRIIKEGRHHA